ncbi:PilZ domain-containing protein [Hahella ganghwensis]|uniref:PilZ domain-containing protein n=1 Tax=Hahella ganghwensis TaxID=286420 RepID=UPI000360817C|nr:PilZ domain-containing protein [Hahella ganghwensis]
MMTSHSMRQYIRHPTDIPIAIEKSQDDDSVAPEEQATRLQNISSGGMCCTTSRPYPVGEKVKVAIRAFSPPFEIIAEVMWCQYTTLGYETGLSFLSSEDAYAARMVEQICHIEHYKREVFINEGRMLSAEEAAQEWIDKFATEFPDSDPLAG